jgi:hypothetical protein
MLSLISTLGGLLISGLPRLLDFFQDKQDKKHELDLARMQSERELALAAQGFAAQARIEEIRTDQVAMQTDAQMTVAALEHDQKVLDRASQWVANYVGTVRPTVTYIFVLELVLINVYLMYWGLKTPGLLTNIQDVMFFADIVFSSDEMAMLGACIGYWFGSRGWQKK